MINILQFICPTGFYGAERWILALAKHLDPQLFRCDLAITLETDSRDLEVVRHFRQNNGTAFELPMHHKFDLSIIDKLCALIKERNIDIIHTHGYKSDIIGVIAAKKAGIKSVCTPHGFENSKDLKLRVFIWLGCQSMRFADKVAPLSRLLCEDSQRFGVKPKNIVYIQNGVDLSEVEAQRKKKRRANTDKKNIGFIGQMISRKNIIDILDIFNELYRKNQNLQLQLLGDGEQRQELEDYSATLPCAKNISFLGFRDDRLALLQNFDLFVMSSSLEGIPRCLMEAMAMGTPVAAYDIPGIDQLLSHEQTGLLAPFGDKKKLANCWERLLQDEQLANTLSQQGREYVEKHYSANRMAIEYSELFQNLAKEMPAK